MRPQAGPPASAAPNLRASPYRLPPGPGTRSRKHGGSPEPVFPRGRDVGLEYRNFYCREIDAGSETISELSREARSTTSVPTTSLQ